MCQPLFVLLPIRRCQTPPPLSSRLKLLGERIVMCAAKLAITPVLWHFSLKIASNPDGISSFDKLRLYCLWSASVITGTGINDLIVGLTPLGLFHFKFIIIITIIITIIIILSLSLSLSF